MTEFNPQPVPVSEDGTVAPIPGETEANQYLRDLSRQRREHAKIVDMYDVEISRLKRERDDLAAAPARKIEMLESALSVWHQSLIAAAKEAGVPEKKWPTLVKLPTGELTSRKGSLSSDVPNEDDEDRYLEFFQWVKKNAPEAIDAIPAAERVNLSALKKLIDVDEESGQFRVVHGEPDPETGEVDASEYAPFARLNRGERTFTPKTP